MTGPRRSAHRRRTSTEDTASRPIPQAGIDLRVVAISGRWPGAIVHDQGISIGIQP
jgi:hypothetical protein